MRISLVMASVLQLEFDRHRRPLSGNRIDRERPSEDVRPRPDAGQSETAACAGRRRCFRIKAAAMIPDRDDYTLRILADRHARCGRSRMLDDVTDTFLHDAVEVDLQ